MARKIMAILEADVEQCKENLKELTEQQKIAAGRPNVFTPPIPTFSSNLSEWPSFWNSLEAYVEKNIKLDSMQKLPHLKKVLA
ncbi:unnamed protein product [Enterobius vermicularis]|uniref:FH2 domain-containing protein n=1 Tax=Enterobius vermicularis TaxID=51028 RepID=A0A0N4VES9_ENTVE|nr:unnamed protein product [Enterobius vermicularis]